MAHKTISRPHAQETHTPYNEARGHDARKDVLPPPETFDWSASGWAGLGAGAAFILIQTLFTTNAVRQIAAIALGESVLPSPSSFTALVFLAAMGVHMILSLIFARILAALINGMPAKRAIMVGAVFGGALYAVNYYLFTNMFPWFIASRGGITLISHIAFGVIAAAIYEQLTSARRSSLR